MINSGNRKMRQAKLSADERPKALEEVLRFYEGKKAGPEALCTPKGSVVAERLVPDGPMLTEPALKGSTAKEPTLMESLIDLSAAIQEDERLKAGPEQIWSPKEPAPQRPASKDPTPKEPMHMDLLIDLSAEGIAAHDWVKAGPGQLYTPKEPTCKEPTPKVPTPIDLLIDLSAEERAKTLHSATWDHDWLMAGSEKLYMPKEPASKEPTREEPTRKEHARKETTCKEPNPKGPPKEPIPKGPTPKEPIPKEPTPKEPTPKEPALKEPSRKEPTPMGTLIDLSNVPRTKVPPLPPMLHGIRHLLGIQRTYEKAVPVFSAIPALVPAKKYDYSSPTYVPAKKPAPKCSSTPPPHMRILSMAEEAARPPHMRASSEQSSLTRSLPPSPSSSRSPSPAPIKTEPVEPVKPALDQSSRFFLTWAEGAPDYVWVQGAQRVGEREW